MTNFIITVTTILCVFAVLFFILDKYKNSIEKDLEEEIERSKEIIKQVEVRELKHQAMLLEGGKSLLDHEVEAMKKRIGQYYA